MPIFLPNVTFLVLKNHNIPKINIPMASTRSPCKTYQAQTKLIPNTTIRTCFLANTPTAKKKKGIQDHPLNGSMPDENLLLSEIVPGIEGKIISVNKIATLSNMVVKLPDILKFKLYNCFSSFKKFVVEISIIVKILNIKQHDTNSQ